MKHIAIALSADHGVVPLPEYRRKQHQEGRRFTARDVTCYQSAEAQLDSKFGEDDWLLRGLYLNYEAIGGWNIRRQEVEDELARALERCSPVKKVWTRTQLETSSEDPDYYFQMYKNGFHPERSPDLFVQLKEFHLVRKGHGTTHGSPYAYDTHVPMVIVFPGLLPAAIDERVHTVVLAPTLASLLGITAPDQLDGMSRVHLLVQKETTNRAQ